MRVFDWKEVSTWPKKSPIDNIDMDSHSDDLFDLFVQEYTHIKMYHACRPIDIENYYKKGIQVANYGNLINVILPSILQTLDANIDKEHIEEEVIKLGNFHNNAICFALDDTFTIKYSGHYLIYGSEYLSSIINSIDNKTNTRLMNGLKSIGIPTMFELNIPIYELNENDIYNIVNIIYNAINMKDGNYQIDFTFQVYKNIDPSYIVGFYHPPKIPDPLKTNEIYTTKI